MKRFILVVAALLSAVAMYAQDGKSIYSKYSDSEDVSAVYISPAMFRLIGKLPELELGDEDVDISSIVKSLDGLYLINTESRQIGESLKKDVGKFVRSDKLELMMEAKDSGETMSLYASSGNGPVTSMVMISSSPEETTFICFEGMMAREQLEDIISKID